MDYQQQQRSPTRRVISISLVILGHLVVVYALIVSLSRNHVEVFNGPLETRLIEEVKKALPNKPPPPLPKLAPPPPPYIPPVEVKVATVAPAANTISQVTTVRPTREQPVIPHVVVPPVLDAMHNCARPVYPSASRRLEESGTVTLRFLIGLDGHAIASKIETSSGFKRLDEAALNALGKCQFKPGTVNGKPEQSWASIRYKWELE